MRRNELGAKEGIKRPPKAKRAPAKSALRKLRLRANYLANTLLANACGLPFWFFEQRRSRLADEIERRRT
jgi:hypothetical protein